MSRVARFSSLHPYRRHHRAARVAWAGFALGIVAGGVLAAAVWQHNWGAEKVIHNGDVPSRDSVAEQLQAAAPPSGRYGVDVLRVIDGDTFEARVHVWPGFELTTRVRLRSVDAPEMKANCSEERQGAEAARDALRALLNDRNVSIWSIGPDKYYGRIVAEASTQQTPSVSAALIARGVVRGYAGGRRQNWCQVGYSGR